MSTVAEVRTAGQRARQAGGKREGLSGQSGHTGCAGCALEWVCAYSYAYVDTGTGVEWMDREGRCLPVAGRQASCYVVRWMDG